MPAWAWQACSDAWPETTQVRFDEGADSTQARGTGSSPARATGVSSGDGRAVPRKAKHWSREQGEPPSAGQMRDIRAHPGAAVELLRACGVADEVWLTAVAEHHERSGSDGYPHGLDRISEPALVLRAIDVFMARISARAKLPAVAPQTAVRQLFQEGGSSPVTMAIVKTLGVHPPGSMLQLRSGEIAVSIRRPLRGTQPMAATLSDGRGRPVAETLRRDTAQPEFAVVGPPSDTTHFPRVLPERVFME